MELPGEHILIETAAVDRELSSLFSLLDDPDPRIASAVTERLRSRGHAVVMPLLDFIETTPEQLAQQRGQQIVREFNEAILLEEFHALASRIDRGHDHSALEDGVFLIARYGYPRLNVESYKFELAALAGMLKDRVAGIHAPLDILAVTNNFFFDEQKFRGNQSRFLEADNSYINKVIDRHIGIPISLATLYLLVAKHRVGLPFSGASAPGHFLIRFDGIENEPLFIDAFNGGVILRKKDIKRFLDASGLPFNDAFLEPAEPRAILLRMIRNLIIVFKEIGDTSAQIAFEHFMQTLAPQANEDDIFAGGFE